LLLNMLIIAGQAIPRGGKITVDPVGSGDSIGFKVSAAGTNAKIPPAVPPLLTGELGGETVDAHRIQPFYAGLLAKACGLKATVAMDGEAVVVSAQ
jgi:histidine phosphotransferase ChpT